MLDDSISLLSSLFKTVGEQEDKIISVLRRGVEPPKPYDAEIEYIESTGTQYIDTGICPTGNTALDLRGNFDYSASISEGNNVGNYFCSRVSSRTGKFFFGSTTIRQPYQFGYSSETTGFSTEKVAKRLILDGYSQQASIEYLDNTSEDLSFTQTAFESTVSIYLFSDHTGTGAAGYFSACRISACLIYEAGVLVFNAIPVRVGQVGYLYDKVSENLFGNSGTGDFVLGQDVA